MFKINKFDLLVSIYIFCIAVAEFMGAKTFPLIAIGDFRLNASVAIFVIPILFTILATVLPPSSRFIETEAAYDEVFHRSIRISAASLIAFAFAEFLDIYIFAKIRESLGKSKLWLRNNVSNISAQFIDTVIFMSLAFYGFDKTPLSNVTFLVSLILPYWLLKSSMSIIETPFVYIGVKWLRKDKLP